MGITYFLLLLCFFILLFPVFICCIKMIKLENKMKKIAFSELDSQTYLKNVLEEIVIDQYPKILCKNNTFLYYYDIFNNIISIKYTEQISQLECTSILHEVGHYYYKMTDEKSRVINNIFGVLKLIIRYCSLGFFILTIWGTFYPIITTIPLLITILKVVLLFYNIIGILKTVFLYIVESKASTFAVNYLKAKEGDMSLKRLKYDLLCQPTASLFFMIFWNIAIFTTFFIQYI